MISTFGIARKEIQSLYSAMLIISSYNLEFIFQNSDFFLRIATYRISCNSIILQKKKKKMPEL